MTQTENKQRHIEITAADLPLHCPTPAMVLWNAHPRVFLPIEKTGAALCPYCGKKCNALPLGPVRAPSRAMSAPPFLLPQ